MRRILGDGVFGDVFWVYDNFPKEYAEASAANGIKTLSQMDKATQEDIQRLLVTVTPNPQLDPNCNPEPSLHIQTSTQTPNPILNTNP